MSTARTQERYDFLCTKMRQRLLTLSLVCVNVIVCRRREVWVYVRKGEPARSLIHT